MILAKFIVNDCVDESWCAVDMTRKSRFFSLLLMAFAISGTVFAGAGKPAAKDKAKDDLYIDNKFCVQCHQEAEEGYLKSPHSDLKKAGSPANELACQSCHGPGKGHAKSFGAVPIRLSKKSALKPTEKDQSCLQCHNKTKLLAKWKTSVHSKKVVPVLTAIIFIGASQRVYERPHH